MKRLLTLIITTPLIFLAGCSTNTLDPHLNQVGDMGSISITDMRSQLKNRLLVAQIMLHNNSGSAITGFYRCQFLDTNKMMLGSPQQWQSVTIYPNEDQAVKCMATQLEATNFKVQFSTDGQNVSVTQTN